MIQLSPLFSPPLPNSVTGGTLPWRAPWWRGLYLDSMAPWQVRYPLFSYRLDSRMVRSADKRCKLCPKAKGRRVLFSTVSNTPYTFHETFTSHRHIPHLLYCRQQMWETVHTVEMPMYSIRGITTKTEACTWVLMAKSFRYVSHAHLKEARGFRPKPY